MAPTRINFTKGLPMRHSAQDLLLADRILVLAEELKASEAAGRIPWMEGGKKANELSQERKALMATFSDSEYILRALRKLEEAADMIIPLQP